MNNGLKSFKIYGLFQSLNVNLKFEEIENIYIGENGIGKTTILSTIFYSLKGKFLELSKIDFESIQIEFENNEVFHFSKDDIEQYNIFNKNIRRRYSPRFYIEFESEFEEKILYLLHLKDELSRSEFRSHFAFREIREEITLRFDFSRVAAEREIFEYMGKLEFRSNIIYKLEKD